MYADFCHFLWRTALKRVVHGQQQTETTIKFIFLQNNFVLMEEQKDKFAYKESCSGGGGGGGGCGCGRSSDGGR
jgi:hypothetical protein